MFWDISFEQVSDATARNMVDLSRPVGAAVRLYSNNLDVDMHNHDRLQSMTEDDQIYICTDTGTLFVCEYLMCSFISEHFVLPLTIITYTVWVV